MKVLHIIWSLLNGGTENMLCDIINYQVKSEKVTLLVVNDMIDDSLISRLDKRCKVITLLRPRGTKNPCFILKMNAIVLFNHYDIVHLHNTNMINYLFVKANYVRTVHCNSISEHKYRWHKAIIAISHSVKDMLKQNGYDSVLINNGVNANLIVPKNNFSKSSVFSILQVGRVVFSEKGQDILLKAIANLVGRGINNIHLDYIGTGCDFQLLSEQIKAMNLSDYVTLKGNQPREYIYEHMCDYNLYVQPSRIEGFGLTVAEAMAAKVPVLISDNPGPMQVIANGKYGYYFKSDSVDGCVNAIEHILDNYPTKEFIDSAYHYVLSYFSIESTARKYVALYEDILKK